jgi:hypothetical protein
VQLLLVALLLQPVLHPLCFGRLLPVPLQLQQVWAL